MQLCLPTEFVKSQKCVSGWSSITSLSDGDDCIEKWNMEEQEQLNVQDCPFLDFVQGFKARNSKS